MFKKKIEKPHKLLGNFDQSLIILIVFLNLLGLVALYNSSSFTAETVFQDKYYFLKEQFKWMVLGFMSFLFCLKFSYKKWYFLSFFLLIFSLFLLLLVIVPGVGVVIKGAKRWLPFGGQPSEFAKLSLVLYLAAWFSHKEKKRLWAFLILCGSIIGLIMLQPDMGTAMVICLTAILLYFYSGASIINFLFMIPFISISSFILIKIAPYRFNRLLTFLDPTIDPLGQSYHIRQVLIALGSGGFWGVGLGNSHQKLSYVPESTTDSIFAIVAEEVGFLGSLFLVLAFAFFIYKGFNIAFHSSDNFGKLLAAGITTFIGLQIIINLSAMVVLIPLTGIPLPFFSYGGSSLLVMLTACGILLNIDKNNRLNLS